MKSASVYLLAMLWRSVAVSEATGKKILYFNKSSGFEHSDILVNQRNNSAVVCTSALSK